ncbi:hypothetical protein [Nocardioides speluncae]|uniref:hypothetical protein n=1 Tax=Nocardioides speluncae TaxID=2670337 RepID=UPI000D686776|nr:hypothetical protein [Nocardioides speluncae]
MSDAASEFVRADAAYESAEAAVLDALRASRPMAQLVDLVSEVARASEAWNAAAYRAYHQSSGDQRLALDQLTERTEVVSELWRDIAEAVADSDSGVVEGWLPPDHVHVALEQISRWIGYSFDLSDWGAVEFGLIDTDSEDPDRWFDYPLVGDPALTIRLARDIDAGLVLLEVRGQISDELGVRTETLLDLLTDPRIRSQDD